MIYHGDNICESVDSEGATWFIVIFREENEECEKAFNNLSEAKRFDTMMNGASFFGQMKVDKA